jgi:hypothetical protein
MKGVDGKEKGGQVVGGDECDLSALPGVQNLVG